MRGVCAHRILARRKIESVSLRVQGRLSTKYCGFEGNECLKNPRFFPVQTGSDMQRCSSQMPVGTAKRKLNLTNK